MNDKVEHIIKWFENIGNRYVENILLPRVQINKMKQGKDYATKMFFHYWAFERQGAPGGYKIAAIKAISSGTKKSLSAEFKKYYHGKLNEKNNPILDDRIKKLDLQRTIKLVAKKNFNDAFTQIKLNGLGHKIRSFFLRDIVYLLNIEKDGQLSTRDYLYMTPIDIWVRLVIQLLKIKLISTNELKRTHFELSKSDFETALKLITVCKKVNQSGD